MVIVSMELHLKENDYFKSPIRIINRRRQIILYMKQTLKEDS
jgi:hypothetical protein